MKILGRIGGNEVILDQRDGASALRLVSEIPTPDGEIRTIQLEVDIDSYKRGDVLISDGMTWKKVDPPEETVGDVTKIVCPRVGRDVKIRWRDPFDEDIYTWKHTVLMRKCGSYPANIFDGVRVIDSYEKDLYEKSPLHDILPAGTENDWFYRFFTVSEDEVVHTSDLCSFQPIELSWKTINDIVRSGMAEKVFVIGDSVVVESETHPDDPFYGKMEFEVVAFDQATPADLERKKSVTFALVGTFGDYATKWDCGWPQYQLTNDVRVTDKTKVYYIYEEPGGFTPITNLPLGKLIPANTYYEKNENVRRTEHGGNRWSMSALRTWLNSTDPTNKWNLFYGCPESDYPSPPLTCLPSDLVQAIMESRNTTALPSSDGRGGEIAIDKLFLLSETEVDGKQIEERFYSVTRDTSPQEIYVKTSDTERQEGKSYFVFDSTKQEYRPAKDSDFNEDGSFKDNIEYFELQKKAYFVAEEGGYRICTDDDFTEDHEFKPDVTYYDETLILITENPFIPYYDDEELKPRIHCSKDGIARTWWLRTPDVNSDTNVKVVDENGVVQTVSEQVDCEHYLVFGFTIS